MLSHANLHFTGRAGHEAGARAGINRSLGTLPLSHAYGLLVTIVGMHCRGAGSRGAAAVV